MIHKSMVLCGQMLRLIPVVAVDGVGINQLYVSDIHDNCAFLDALVNAFKNSGKLVGIYSSLYQWESIFGNRANCPFFTGLPLWYAHYDNDPSFNDYAKYSFGGWSKPSIKQYVGDTSACGVGIDLNYY